MNPILEDYQKAIARLEEVLKLSKVPVHRDSAIKRFELCVDLAWKSVKMHLRREGIECNSPRSCIREAFRLGLVENDDRWLKMIDDRNTSVHLYKEMAADDIYQRLPDYLKLFIVLRNRLALEI